MTIQQKNRILVIGFIATLVVGYYLSISETLLLKSNYDQLKENERVFKNIPQRLGTLTKKEVYYDSLLKSHQITETSLQNNLLKTLERYAQKENIKIVSFTEPHNYIENDKSVNSYAFRVSGTFKSILGLAYELEQRSKFGMIASLEFEKITSYRTGAISLEGDFILRLVQ